MLLAAYILCSFLSFQFLVCNIASKLLLSTFDLVSEVPIKALGLKKEEMKHCNSPPHTILKLEPRSPPAHP